MINAFAALKASVAALNVVRDPNRLDEVFVLADNLATNEIMAEICAEFERDPDGARALRARPRMGHVDLSVLGSLPVGTLGREFADHMTRNGLDPSAIPAPPSHDPPTFVRAHLYETHDVWHVVTGFGADVAGELGLQAFYLAQLPGKLPLVLITSGLLNALFYSFDDRFSRMDAIVRGWSLGRSARPLFGVDWKQLWTTPLSEVRARFAIDLARTDATIAVRGTDVHAAAA